MAVSNSLEYLMGIRAKQLTNSISAQEYMTYTLFEYSVLARYVS